MNIKDYKQALFAHYGVKNARQLRRDPVWQEFARENNLPELKGEEAWACAYRAVFETEQSELEDNAIANAISEATSTIINTGLSEIQKFGSNIQGIISQATDNGKAQLKSYTSETEQPLSETFESASDRTKASSSAPLSVKNQSEEIASFTKLHNQKGQPVGVLLQYSSEQSQKLKEHFKSLSLHSPQAWHQGNINSAVVDQLGGTAAVVATGLNAGQLYRVVNSTKLLDGIKNGAYSIVQNTGTVRDLGTGQFIGQLRFAKVTAAPILAPIVVYQVLHCIVGTQQINEINQHLAQMERTLEKLHVRQEAGVLGEIHYAVNVLDDILLERTRTGTFSTDSSNRLAHVEKSIVSILERNRLLVEHFRAKTDAVKAISGSDGARSASELLKSDGSQAIHDIKCLVGLIAADIKLEQTRMYLAMQNNPTDVGRRQERLQEKMHQYRQAISNLPSVKELEHHAQSCLNAMKWWETLFDFGQTKKAVRTAQDFNIEDFTPQPSALNSSLGGYIFWKDEDGTHAFEMSGDDLRLEPA